MTNDATGQFTDEFGCWLTDHGVDPAGEGIVVAGQWVLAHVDMHALKAGIEELIREAEPSRQVPPAARELYEPSGMPPPPAPYITAESHAYDLTGPGPWTFTSRAQDPAVVTTHDGPVTDAALAMIRAAYPQVGLWAIRPQRIDETYRDTGVASRRISVLLGVEKHTARAILTIASDETLGMRYVHGPWEITGDEDEHAWRIRNINPGPATVLVPVTRGQAERVVPVLRDWANAGAVTTACLGVAGAIDQAIAGADPTGGTR